MSDFYSGFYGALTGAAITVIAQAITARYLREGVKIDAEIAEVTSQCDAAKTLLAKMVTLDVDDRETLISAAFFQNLVSLGIDHPVHAEIKDALSLLTASTSEEEFNSANKGLILIVKALIRTQERQIASLRAASPWARIWEKLSPENC